MSDGGDNSEPHEPLEVGSSHEGAAPLRSGGIAHASGSKTPRKVQWAANTKDEESNLSHHLDEQGLDVSDHHNFSLRTLCYFTRLTMSSILFEFQILLDCH